MKKNYKSPVSRVWNVRGKENMMGTASMQCYSMHDGDWGFQSTSVKEEEDNTVSIWDLY